MKRLRYCTILLFLSLIISACDKDDESYEFEIDNDVEYYKNYSPDHVVQKNDSLLLDIDNNGSMDIGIYINSYGDKDIYSLNQNFSFSTGNYTGSGTANLKVIKFNEIIAELQHWHKYHVLYPNTIKYVGLRRTAKHPLYDWVSYISYGWIKVSVDEESVTIEELYIRKEPDTVVKAGIREY